MITATFCALAPRAAGVPPVPVVVPTLLARDAAGTVWAHANPAELYRWIARRNDLLTTIAVASGRSSTPRVGVGLVVN